MLKPANKLTLHDNILSQMMHAIRKGEWLPGEKLPNEQTLAKQFAVSRNSLREVLKALVLAGILEARPGQGTFLTQNAIHNLEAGNLASTVCGNASLWDLKEVRCLLEGHIAYMAAKRATKEQIEELAHALMTDDKEENLTESHARFHKILAGAAGNSLLASMLMSVQREMDVLRQKYSLMPRATLETFTAEHTEIYRKVKACRPEEAREAMLKHIEDAWSDSLYADIKEEDLEAHLKS